MNRRSDSCPAGCGTPDGQAAVAAPSIWTDTLTGAIGSYRCPVCGVIWTTSYREELDSIDWAAGEPPW